MQNKSAAPIWQARGTSIAAFVGLWFASTSGGSAFAQSLEVSPGGAIGLGNRGWSAAETNRATSANELEFSARAGVASDYRQAGVTFTYKVLNLDLRYYDSQENCFVFTGDPNARPGGRVDLITNPAGLVSNWCGATFVAKAWFAF
jgi:hypothetical protein